MSSSDACIVWTWVRESVALTMSKMRRAKGMDRSSLPVESPPERRMSPMAHWLRPAVSDSKTSTPLATSYSTSPFELIGLQMDNVVLDFRWLSRPEGDGYEVVAVHEKTVHRAPLSWSHPTQRSCAQPESGFASMTTSFPISKTPWHMVTAAQSSWSLPLATRRAPAPKDADFQGIPIDRRFRRRPGIHHPDCHRIETRGRTHHPRRRVQNTNSSSGSTSGAVKLGLGVNGSIKSTDVPLI